MTSVASTRLTWVVGAGGLLGGALSTELTRRGERVWRTAKAVPWERPDSSLHVLKDNAERLVEDARRAGRPWRVAWCAGAGVTATSSTALDVEVAVLTGFLHHLGRLASDVPGSLFLASSAGGVYAGSSSPPYTERHPAVPISPYGKAKLSCEQAALAFGERTGTQVLVGRLANLYGPGQNLAKSQGLISHICRSQLTAQPISVYVPLDTVRDYLFVRDCAAMIADGLDLVGLQPTGTAAVKIFASQQGTTIGALLGECRRIFKRAPRVVLGQSSSAAYQAKDLRLRSEVWRQLDHRSLTPLPAGIHATWAALSLARQVAR